MNLHKGPRVALIVDHPHRDLPGLTLVASALAMEGVTVYLVPMNLQEEVFALAPDFALLPHLRASNEEFAGNMLEAGIRLGILDTEGSIFSQGTMALAGAGGPASATGLDEYSITMARDPETRFAVSCFCAWSRDFVDHAIAAGWYDRGQMRVTGTPRVDWLHRRWAPATQALWQDPGIGRGFVLILGSFPLANPAFQSPAQEASMMIRRFGYDPDSIRLWQQMQADAMNGLAGLVDALAATLPEIQFVYRPHPFEKVETYKGLIREAPNLALIRSGTVDGWILNCMAVVHWGSSVAVDAAVVGIPAFTPSSLPVHLPIPLVDACTQRLGEAELVGALRSIAESAYEIPNEILESSRASIHAAFSDIDGEAHKRVAKAVVDSLHSAGPRVNTASCLAFTRRKSGSSIRAAASSLGRQLLGPTLYWKLRTGLPRSGARLWDRSQKGFDESSVNDLLSAIATVSPEGGRLRARGPVPGDHLFIYPPARCVVVEALEQ